MNKQECPNCGTKSALINEMTEGMFGMALCGKCLTFLIRIGASGYTPVPESYLEKIKEESPKLYERVMEATDKIKNATNNIDEVLSGGDIEASFKLYTDSKYGSKVIEPEILAELKDAYYLGASFIFKTITELPDRKDGKFTLNSLQKQLENYVSNIIKERRERGAK